MRLAGSMRSWLMRPAVLRTLLANVRLAVRLIREPRVALFAKSVPILAVVYVLSPVDFVPDVLPLVGELDDVAILLVALNVFLRLCPGDSVGFHRAAIDGGRRYSPMPPLSSDYIDAEWRRA